jgi:hypothetical protein
MSGMNNGNDASLNVVDKVTGFFSDLLKSKSSDTNTNKQYLSNEYGTSTIGTIENKIGGARSRRRKCNKKHRHTKSCRKYVKKGRKTRKH